jgi:hypothetical protein
MPLLLYLPVCGCCFITFFIVFHILNAIFICVSFNGFVIFLLSFSLYVKVDHFVFWFCRSISVFCFCEAGMFFDFVYIVIIAM